MPIQHPPKAVASTHREWWRPRSRVGQPIDEAPKKTKIIGIDLRCSIALTSMVATDNVQAGRCCDILAADPETYADAEAMWR